jgi:predicted Kef-type K+ transport protein
MEAIWIALAFGLGLLVRQVGLPSLVGYLLAGFILNAMGLEGGEILRHLAHLFSIGLKLNLKNFVRIDNWGGGGFHLAIVTLGLAPALHYIVGMDWRMALLLAVSLGFSSTVIAAKALESRRELRAFHGRIAIGILVFQDVIAVALMSYASGISPSPWSLTLLVALPLSRPLIIRLLQWSGHDELLILFGLMLAVAGGTGFELLGLSSELGALVLGVLIAGHGKSKELADALWGLKEIFLVGFFLQIGMSGTPDLQTIGYALLLTLLLPLKTLVFFVIMLLLRLRSRTAFLASLSLASYSEFGLIVANIAAKHGWLHPDWVLLMAVTIALSFAIAAPLNRIAHPLYERFENRLLPLESQRKHPDDEPISLGKASIVIMGMGRVGTGAYDFLRERNERIVGLDSDPAKVRQHRVQHRRVVYADAEDPGFWSRLRIDEVRAVLLALPDPEANHIAARQLRRRGFDGLISAATRHPEEARVAATAGADMTFNIYDEAGVGFAEHVWEKLHPDRREPQPTQATVT